LALVAETLAQVAKAQVNGIPFFTRVDVLVWTDKRFQDRDCGLTAALLRKELPAAQDGIPVTIHEVDHGDIFCGILNYGVAMQMAHGITHSLVMSPDAASYLTPDAVADFSAAIDAGARAAGLATHELADSVMQGRFTNTFSLWETSALLTVGGFDLIAAKPADDRVGTFLRSWSLTEEETTYALAGVEEIIPLIRLVDVYGPCIAPIRLRTDAPQQYVVPDAATQPELFRRHTMKMEKKMQRQAAMAASAGADLDYLKGGILPAYRV
jgi:hypothetical protein